MATQPDDTDSKIYALINYEDPYVQPLILSALEQRLPPSAYQLITSLSFLPSPTSRFLQFLQYESIDFGHLLSHPTTSLANAYIIRKALIRKHYLSTTISNWITKYPDSVLKKHVQPSVEFEVDYAEFLNDALVEAWELRESWQRGEGKDVGEREWWILKPGMSERGQGIRLFSEEEELTAIFEEWDPESDEDEEDETEDGDRNEDARSDDGTSPTTAIPKPILSDAERMKKEEGKGIITSQLRHFIAQPYIHPPLLLHPPSSPIPSASVPSDQALRKFHIRTYILATGALKIHIYKAMLALFAARPYTPPWSTSASTSDPSEALKAHLTNTCLQDTGEREGSVGLFWSLPDEIPNQPGFPTLSKNPNWKDDVFAQICSVTGEVFQAAARGMGIHFQLLPNAFEIFGLDFMVGVETDGSLNTWLLEVNAFPDFRQTGDELKGLVGGLFEGVVDIAVAPFFSVESKGEGQSGKMVKVLDIDLGRR
ncbi:tubulin-tyrosine ligase [Lentithecium fluviatile CBS 122367]|uniref:Tubulin-tyrosine ligase n=1 Tax=Lentithecium fluviatile CBS 122367 TaxID=1168545 RepID=A0A6G1JAN8_9PLEO|nr:tubulin-tyrosine ligase [Lentithecium fluviatile CBS 122367]